MLSNELTFPYYIYPGLPAVHGYYDTKKYNKELNRLYEFISDLNINDKIFLHITIGAAAEELFTRKTNNNDLIEYEFQYQQLFPEHLTRIFNQTTNDILHIIIAPNISFDTSNLETFKVPQFIDKTPEMGWINIDNKTFIDKTKRYKVMIFYTMMPTKDTRNNDLIKHFKSIKLEEYFDINLIHQTEYDIKFVNTFYDKLTILFNNVNKNNGLVTCFSFCVFNEHTNRSHIKNYLMFNEIIKLFDKIYKHRILAEWRYILGSYVVVNYNNNKHIKYIKQTNMNDSKNVCIINVNDFEN